MTMKKIFRAFLACLLIIGLVGCSKSKPTLEIQEGVELELLDVLRVNNKLSNSVYYYFLASVTNDSEKVYHMSNLEYVAQDQSTENKINPIERYQTTIATDVNTGMSTLVYGYIGYPDAKEKNVGLFFPKTDSFIPFSSVNIRQINDSNIVNSDEKKFTIYEDNDFSFSVDATNVEYSYENGTSYVKGLQLTYSNKSQNRLVVPYLTPVCTMTGVKLSSYSNENELKSMSLDTLRKQDFYINEKPPKTEEFTGEATGYQVFYLSPEQTLSTPVNFSFEGEIPDFTSDRNQGLTINITSPALGYSQVIKVSY